MTAETPSPAGPPFDWHAFVSLKLEAVFGAKAAPLMEKALAAADLDHVDSRESVERLANVLNAFGPMEKAAASMLRMAATLQRIRGEEPAKGAP